MSKKSIILGYWDFRGYGEACRYLLEYCGCDYEDKQYERTRPDDYSNWRTIREDFGLDFPNLPYLIDGDRKLTESTAILKYLGRKHGLAPETEDEMINSDILEGVILDIRDRFYHIFFCPEGQYQRTAKEFQEGALLPKLGKISQFIGSKKWLLSDKLTYADFMLYTRLAQSLCIFPNTLDDLPRLKLYMADFEALPAINRYQKSERFAKYPEHDPYVREENICKQ